MKMSNVLQSIARSFEARAEGEVRLDGEFWREDGVVIAGKTHLSRTDQLKSWCEDNGLYCEYNEREDYYIIGKEKGGE